MTGSSENENQDDDRGRLALGKRLIANALQYSSAPVSETASLRNLKHDADLLPRIQGQLRTILDAFHRDSAATYDIQGLSDHGCDLLVRLESASSCAFIGFQVKSHSELSEPGIVNKLLLQYSAASDHYAPMLNFYVVLAADLTAADSRKSVVRNIHQAFSLKPKVRVVDPLYTATFLGLTPSAIDSLTTQTMRTGDPVLTAAKGDLHRHPLDAAIILLMVVGVVEGRFHVSMDELLHNRWLQAIVELVPFPSLASTAYGRSFDSSPILESALRDSLGLPSSASSREADRSKGWAYLSNSQVLKSLPDDLLRCYLSANSATPDAASRLAEVLPPVVNRLEGDELTGLDPDFKEFRIEVGEHVALLCLVAEGKARHALDGQQLIDYLVQLLLSGDG